MRTNIVIDDKLLDEAAEELFHCVHFGHQAVVHQPRFPEEVPDEFQGPDPFLFVQDDLAAIIEYISPGVPQVFKEPQVYVGAGIGHDPCQVFILFFFKYQPGGRDQLFPVPGQGQAVFIQQPFIAE